MLGKVIYVDTRCKHWCWVNRVVNTCSVIVNVVYYNDVVIAETCLSSVKELLHRSVVQVMPRGSASVLQVLLCPYEVRGTKAKICCRRVTLIHVHPSRVRFFLVPRSKRVSRPGWSHLHLAMA